MALYCMTCCRDSLCSRLWEEELEDAGVPASSAFARPPPTGPVAGVPWAGVSGRIFNAKGESPPFARARDALTELPSCTAQCQSTAMPSGML
eukprot:1633325-Rhodomonas_salina.1